MKTSSDGIEVMHFYEQCKLEAYPDPGSADGHPWTIGWGHTGPEVVPGLVWTQEQADEAFKADLVRFESAVNHAVMVNITQSEFDALVAFAYNLGERALKTSTLLRKLNAGDKEGARREFERWNKNDGKVMRGLTRRRASESALFAGHTAEDAIEIGQQAA